MADAGGNGAQSIEELQRRYQHLQQERVRAEANRDNAQKQLADLKAEARETYGTDDIEELRAKLAGMKTENEKKRAEYQAHLEKIEADLAQAEADAAGAEASDGAG